MQILFIDESGTPPPPSKAANTPYFILGGVVVPEDFWQRLSGDLQRLKEQFGVAGEIKWRHFAPDKGGDKHSLSHLSGEQKEQLRAALYAAMCSYKSIRLICVATNVAAAYKLPYIASADDLYWYSYKQLTERFQYYLQDLERTVGQRVRGIVVCDNRNAQDDDRLRNLHMDLMAGKRSTMSRYGNLIEGLFIAPSQMSVGIQFADMVAGAVFRKVKAGDSRFFDQVEGAFRRSPTGKLEGYGLVRFPAKW
ncbi:MAG: DUF3800 domain-containing protein [Rubrivivax sp.]|nr:DUF3800 domain-containing protein [Rubrivivax sp.]